MCITSENNIFIFAQTINITRASLLADLVKTAKIDLQNHGHSPQILADFLEFAIFQAKKQRFDLTKSLKIRPFIFLTNVTIVNIIATKR